MGKLLKPDFYTQGEIPVGRVRKAAKKNCEKLLCIGVDKKGEPYYAASCADGGELLWMVEQFKRKLLNGDFAPD